MSFNPAPKQLVVNELIEQGYTPDLDDALRLCHNLEEQESLHHKLAIGLTAVGIVGTGITLAFVGAVATMLVPIAAIGVGAMGAWNHPIRGRRRDDEADFLRVNPKIIGLIESKLNAGEADHKVSGAYLECFRAWANTGQPLMLPDAADIPMVAPAVAAVGPTTKLAAIPTAAVTIPPVETAPPETYPMAAREVSKDDRAALIARLNQDCPALVKLIKSHPIRLTGTQRSGKSTIAKILGLLRMVLLPGHGVIAATPHYEPANPYPKVFTVAGVTPQGKRDYPAIERQWFGMADRVESCQQSNVSYVWDEFGLFDQAIADTDDDKDKIKRVLTSCLRETMKFGIYPMFIVHGETAAFLPGSKGLVTVFLNSTVRVEAIGEQVQDEMGLPTLRPTGRFNVTYLDGTKDEGKIPEWLTEDYLLGLIGDQKPPKLAEPERFERKQEVKTPLPRKSKILVPTRRDTSAARIEELRSELERLETYHGLAPLEPDRSGAPFRPITKAENAERIREVQHAIDAASIDAESELLDDDAIDDDELAIRAEVKRFLSENPDGAKVKDFVNRARKPVRKMASDDVKFVLELMELENEIYSVDGNYFTKAN